MLLTDVFLFLLSVPLHGVIPRTTGQQQYRHTSNEVVFGSLETSSLKVITSVTTSKGDTINGIEGN